ncbi:host cell division inhibitor Icd-like protein [Aeromonas hydrophila]|uniref:host cell division inhibitor Icd-like protein n=1 Tax=Aeromonas hydrophila TaxID=644 RepID=UPI003EC61A13
MNDGMISIADGLDTRLHGWRIRHPRAATKPRTICTLSPTIGNLPVVYPVLGAWVGSQRKRPHCAFLGLALSCGYPIRLGLLKPRTLVMIFTFLIASSACRLADMRRIRTISAVADTESEARARLAGLPLVFLSRTPTKGGRV